MKIEYFSLKNKYEIRYKLFLPENAVDNVIIGVHGFAGDKESSMLEKLADAISKKNTALLCFDFAAHGESPVNEDLLTVENCKSDLCFTVDYALNKYPNAKISIFATSFGGFITLQCAEKYNNIPLVLRAPAVTMPKVLLENVLKISEAEFKARGTVECGFERSIKLPYRFYEELLCATDLMTADITSPMLIIHGDSDDIVPISHVKAFRESHKNATLKAISGADHRFKNPGETEAVITFTTEFLNI